MGARIPTVVEVAFIALVLPVAVAYLIALAVAAWSGISTFGKRLHRNSGRTDANPAAQPRKSGNREKFPMF